MDAHKLQGSTSLHAVVDSRPEMAWEYDLCVGAI